MKCKKHAVPFTFSFSSLKMVPSAMETSCEWASSISWDEATNTTHFAQPLFSISNEHFKTTAHHATHLLLKHIFTVRSPYEFIHKWKRFRRNEPIWIPTLNSPLYSDSHSILTEHVYLGMKTQIEQSISTEMLQLVPLENHTDFSSLARTVKRISILIFFGRHLQHVSQTWVFILGHTHTNGTKELKHDM